MTKEQLIGGVRQRVKRIFEGEGSGHDWWHIYRVTETAKKIGAREGADLFLVEISALLHDVGDYKLYAGNNMQEKLINELLGDFSVEQNLIDEVVSIVKSVSFKGAGVDTIPNSIEGKVVQDADRLDAIGAIGIARAFAYGGHHNRLLYHPEESPEFHTDFETYKKAKGHTINHFYEKLLLLKDRMQTSTGKELAEERHQFMMLFLENFKKEWNGNKYED